MATKSKKLLSEDEVNTQLALEYDRILTDEFEAKVVNKMNALLQTLPTKPNQALNARVENLLKQSQTSQVFDNLQ